MQHLLLNVVLLTAALMLIIPGLMAGISTALEPASARWLLPPEVAPRIADIQRQDLWVHIPVNERPLRQNVAWPPPGP